MVEQLVDLPKVRYQGAIQRRTAEQIVALPALVLPQRISERISEQSEIIKVTETSNQDQNWQRAVEQTLMGSGDKFISQIMEEDFEVDNIVLPERTSEKICEQSEVIKVTETASQDQNLQHTVEQTLLDFAETKLSLWSLSWRGGLNRSGLSKCPRSQARKVTW